MVHSTRCQRYYKKLLETRSHLHGYVPNAGFEESPKTVDVSTSFHDLETTAKAEER